MIRPEIYESNFRLIRLIKSRSPDTYHRVIDNLYVYSKYPPPSHSGIYFRPFTYTDSRSRKVSSESLPCLYTRISSGGGGGSSFVTTPVNLEPTLS